MREIVLLMMQKLCIHPANPQFWNIAKRVEEKIQKIIDEEMRQCEQK